MEGDSYHMITFTASKIKAILQGNQAIAIEENTLHINRFKINPIAKQINIDFIKGYVSNGEFIQTEDKLLSIEVKGNLYERLMTFLEGDKMIDKIENAIVSEQIFKQLGMVSKA